MIITCSLLRTRFCFNVLDMTSKREVYNQVPPNQRTHSATDPGKNTFNAPQPRFINYLITTSKGNIAHSTQTINKQGADDKTSIRLSRHYNIGIEPRSRKTTYYFIGLEPNIIIRTSIPLLLPYTPHQTTLQMHYRLIVSPKTPLL